MELKKVQKVTEKTEENVLTISEKEFTDIVKDVAEKALLTDKKVTQDEPMLMLLLAASYAQFAGALHKKLFKQEESNGNSK